MRKLFLILFMIFVNANIALANVTIPDNMKQALKHSPDTPSIINIVASLVIVIILIYVVSWIYMKLSQVNTKNLFKQPKELEFNKAKIISGITLGQNRNLYVVELNNKYLVLGVTPNNINLIKEFDKDTKQDLNKILDDTKNEIKNTQNEKEPIVETLFKKEPEKNLSDNKEIDDICKKYL